MKLSKRFVILTIAVFATLLGTSALSKSPFQTEEFEFFEDIYISCLDELVSAHFYITVRYREFETPSATSHYIEHWNWDVDLIGLRTDRIWIGSGFSPGSFHTGKGEVGQWTSHEVVRQVTGDKPDLRYDQRFKYTFNANGDLKVEWLPPEDLGDWYRCLGPNH